VLAAMMAGWVGMRFALWPQETIQALERGLPVELPAEFLAEAEAEIAPVPPSAATPVSRSAADGRTVQSPARFAQWRISPLVPPIGAFAGSTGDPVGQAAGHDLLWIAAVTRGAYGYPVPAIANDVGRRRSLPYKSAPAAMRSGRSPDRWALDTWLLWRADGIRSAAVAPASYGASQAGALLSYRLAPGSRLAPRAYARATGFPGGASHGELAAGLSVRPIAALPVRAQVELRARETGAGPALRPAAMLVGGTDREIAGIEVRAYGQIGYVGGGDATAFADGQLTLRKAIAARGGFRLAAGGGAWGGAQQGAARVDVGPSASLTLATGQLTARVEADYRIRVAGDAAPGSGPALTVSASF
jgi:hypothetical protein